jgi:hypothetical protein
MKIAARMNTKAISKIGERYDRKQKSPSVKRGGFSAKSINSNRSH